jgi:hypothetical protein
LQKMTACLSFGIVCLLQFLQPGGSATFVCAEGTEKSSAEIGEDNRTQLEFYARGFSHGSLAGSKYMVSLQERRPDLRNSELIAKSIRRAFADLNEAVKEMGPLGFHDYTSPKTTSLYRASFMKGFEEAWPIGVAEVGENFEVIMPNLSAAERAKGPEIQIERCQQRQANELKNAVLKEAARLNISRSAAASIYEPMTPEGIEKYLYEK